VYFLCLLETCISFGMRSLYSYLYLDSLVASPGASLLTEYQLLLQESTRCKIYILCYISHMLLLDGSQLLTADLLWDHFYPALRSWQKAGDGLYGKYCGWPDRLLSLCSYSSRRRRRTISSFGELLVFESLQGIQNFSPSQRLTKDY
jgi:hypothetical protein